MTNTSHMDVRALLARQQLMNQREHKRLARRIHDEISQKMTLLALQISLASSEKSPPANWAVKCKDWANLVMELGQSIRSVTNELQPRILDEFGLVAALRWFAQASAGDICCTFIAPQEDIPLAPFAANELFGVCREIVTDILVPDVSRVEIALEEKEGTVRLHLRADDNGLARELITETALDGIAAHDWLLWVDGSVELSHSAEGSVVTLSVPSVRPLAFSAN